MRLSMDMNANFQFINQCQLFLDKNELTFKKERKKERKKEDFMNLNDIMLALVELYECFCILFHSG